MSAADASARRSAALHRCDCSRHLGQARTLDDLAADHALPPRVLSTAEAEHVTYADLRPGDAVYDGCFLRGVVASTEVRWGTVHVKIAGLCAPWASAPTHPVTRRRRAS